MTDITLAAVARPGDTVIIAFSIPLTDEDIDQIEKSFQGLRDAGIKVLFADQVSSIAIARPNDEQVKE